MLKENMRPEFLNRIDEKIMFLPLNKEEIKQIAKLQIGELQERLAQSDLGIELTDAAWDLLAERGYDPQFGARPLKRVVQHDIVNVLSKKLLASEYLPNEIILLDAKDKKFVFNKKKIKEES
jgi:ATP-dependent Clp protease ATP-binding subunit ClpB